jgi:hypothetical protein
MTILFQYLSHSAFSIILEVCIVHAPAAGIILCFHLSPVICLPNTPKREFKRYGIIFICVHAKYYHQCTQACLFTSGAAHFWITILTVTVGK